MSLRDPLVPVRVPCGEGKIPRRQLPRRVRREQLVQLLQSLLVQMGSRIWTVGIHLWKRQCTKPAKQCLWSIILCLSTVTGFNSQRYGRFDFDDHIHRVSNGLDLPRLHSLLHPEGLLHHLCDHIRTELHPVCAELQATGLLERGLETTAPSQERLKTNRRRMTSRGKPLKIVTCHQETFLPNKCSFCRVCKKIKQGKKNVIFRDHRFIALRGRI